MSEGCAIAFNHAVTQITASRCTEYRDKKTPSKMPRESHILVIEVQVAVLDVDYYRTRSVYFLCQYVLGQLVQY